MNPIVQYQAPIFVETYHLRYKTVSCSFCQNMQPCKIQLKPVRYSFWLKSGKQNKAQVYKKIVLSFVWYL